MALIVADRVLESSTSTGTGNFSLAGAATGYRAFDDVCANGDTVYYTIEAVDGNGNPSGAWETGLGTFNDTDTLVRTSVSASSNANNAVDFAAGTKRVFLNVTASQIAGFYRSGGTDVALADGGTGASLVDPNADRILFWDDSAGAVAFGAPTGGLSISGTDITAANPSLVLIGTYTASGSTAVADFTSIPSTYKDLVIVVNARNGTAVFGGDIAVTVNGLTTAIYDRQRHYTLATSNGSDNSLGQTSFGFPCLAGSSAGTDHCGSGVLEIIAYANTTFQKNMIGNSTTPDSVANALYTFRTSGRIRTTAAINQVTLTSASNMVAGSTIYLYGRS
jgi:hypothetical protein